jgi:7-cyano-7-deazaguanine synthase in queuosine biosynthesis
MPHRGAAGEAADPAAHPPASADPDSWLSIDLHTERRNVTLRPHKLIAHRASARALDLLDIAAVTLMTDIAVRRGVNEAWVRDLDIRVAVREPGYWEELAEQLERIVHFLTGDNIRFAFARRPEREPGAAAGQGEAPDADCVCLLSGGIDSFAGASALLKANRLPLFVSHASGSPSVDEAQRQVIGALGALFSRELTRLDLFLGASRLRDPESPFPTEEEREPSQRSRSFFFLAAAVAAADAAGVEEIYACENGILASHLPPTRARIGSLSTRSNHPQLLARTADLATDVLGREVVVMNPFQGQTKAEVIRDVLRPEMPIDDIQRSVSCWQIGRAPRPCGGCIPCLVRRISMLAAGLPDEAYMIDILADPLAHRDSDAFANLMELLMLAADFRMGDDDMLLLHYPELVDGVAYGALAAEVANVYRRFADEVFAVVAQHFPATATLLGTSETPGR